MGCQAVTCMQNGETAVRIRMAQAFAGVTWPACPAEGFCERRARRRDVLRTSDGPLRVPARFAHPPPPSATRLGPLTQG